jgi:hypothetical protein
VSRTAQRALRSGLTISSAESRSPADQVEGRSAIGQHPAQFAIQIGVLRWQASNGVGDGRILLGPVVAPAGQDLPSAGPPPHRPRSGWAWSMPMRDDLPGGLDRAYARRSWAEAQESGRGRFSPAAPQWSRLVSVASRSKTKPFTTPFPSLPCGSAAGRATPGTRSRWRPSPQHRSQTRRRHIPGAAAELDTYDHLWARRSVSSIETVSSLTGSEERIVDGLINPSMVNNNVPDRGQVASSPPDQSPGVSGSVHRNPGNVGSV